MNQQSLAPIDRASLRARVYDILQRAIVTGELEPGQRVRDQDIAGQLDVSRTPVREALQRLEDEGLVETRRGSLTRIMPLDTPAARDAFPLVAALHAFATRAATSHLTPADFAALRAANDALAAALSAGDVMGAIAADDRFHLRFVQSARNSELAPTLDRLTPKIRRLEVAQFGSLAGRRSVEQHVAIIAAAEQRDAHRAAELVEQNWLSLGELILAALSQSEPRSHSSSLTPQ
jgi:DNA-binding GntR family transcriptional regulator